MDITGETLLAACASPERLEAELAMVVKWVYQREVLPLPGRATMIFKRVWRRIQRFAEVFKAPTSVDMDRSLITQVKILERHVQNMETQRFKLSFTARLSRERELIGKPFEKED
jgi:uncharacterized protein (DUF2267 family)